MTSAYNHREVAARKIGRPLVAGEVVHHKNCVPGDNRPDNLAVLPSREHHRLHYGTDLGIGSLVPLYVEFACGCISYVANGDHWGPGRTVTHDPCGLHKDRA